MKHYHGTPLGGTRDGVARFMAAAGRFFLIPFYRQEDLGIAAECATGFMFDNSAYTAWKSGKPIESWQPYYDWCNAWRRNPRFEFAIIPDQIDGSVEQNKALVQAWRDSTDAEGAPVWHLHEPLDYLEFLVSAGFRTVCIGSSGDYSTPGTEDWHRRMGRAMNVLCDSYGRPHVKIHGLRMLAPEIVDRYPFASADSTNVAQNSQIVSRYGMYTPPTTAQRREVLAVSDRGNKITRYLDPSRQAKRTFYPSGTTNMNTHTTTVHGRCPINGAWDYYTLTVQTEEFFKAEELEELCDFARGKNWTQEEIAKQLRAIIPHHCTVLLKGRHGQNCETVVFLPTKG